MRNGFYCRVLRFGSPTPILHRFSDSSPFELWLPPPRSFSTPWCLRSRTIVLHLASRFVGFVFELALLSDCGHRLRVPMMCDDSTVVASVSLQDGTVSRFPLLVDVSPFGVVRVPRPPPPSDSLPGQFRCSGRFSSTVGIRLWGPSGFSTPVDATLLHAWDFPVG